MKPLLLALCSVGLVAARSPLPFGEPVSEAELSQMRGGFVLPGGLEIALSVVTQTSVDGATLLRSEFRLAEGAPELRIFTGNGAAGNQPAATFNSTAGTSDDGRPDVTYSPETGLTILPANPSGLPVSIGIGAPLAPAAGDPSLRELDVAPGTAVATAAGTVTLDRQDLSDRVRLQSTGLDVTHLFGSAFGAITVNSADDRSIDTVTSASIAIGNVSSETLGISMLQVDTLSLDAAQIVTRQGVL